MMAEARLEPWCFRLKVQCANAYYNITVPPLYNVDVDYYRYFLEVFSCSMKNVLGKKEVSMLIVC